MGKSVRQSRFLFGVFLNIVVTVSSSLLAVVLVLVTEGTF